MSLDTFPSVSSSVPGLDIARSQVANQSAFRKFGASAVVGTTETPISYTGTIWQPTAATTLEAISSDADDTAAGAGAQTIVIVGLNASFVEVSETLTMAGASASAASSNSYIRIYRAYVASTGTYAGTNQGTITVRIVSAGATVIQIAAGLGQTQTTFYTVPAGKTLYVSDIHIGVSSLKAMDVFSFQLPNADDVATSFSGAKRLVNEYLGVVSIIDLEYKPPLAFSAKTDVWFAGMVAAGTGSASIEYAGTLVG